MAVQGTGEELGRAGSSSTRRRPKFEEEQPQAQPPPQAAATDTQLGAQGRPDETAATAPEIRKGLLPEADKQSGRHTIHVPPGRTSKAERGPHSATSDGSSIELGGKAMEENSMLAAPRAEEAVQLQGVREQEEPGKAPENLIGEELGQLQALEDLQTPPEDISKAAAQTSSTSTAPTDWDVTERPPTEQPATAISPERSRSTLLARQAAEVDPLSASPGRQTEPSRASGVLAEPNEELLASAVHGELPQTAVTGKLSEKEAAPSIRQLSDGTDFPSATETDSARAAEHDRPVPTDTEESAPAILPAALIGETILPPSAQHSSNDIPVARVLASALSGNSMQLSPSGNFLDNDRISTALKNESSSSPSKTAFVSGLAAEEVNSKGVDNDQGADTLQEHD